MTSFTARRRTYNDCFPKIHNNVDEIADSGFFYTGQGDLVICFHCNGGLEDWQLCHQPWVRHAQMYPECAFVARSKGSEFIVEALDRLNHELKGRAPRNKPEPTKIVEPMHCLSCNEDAEVGFFSCGHVCACQKCVKDMTICPRCNIKITSFFRVYHG
jgi:hypothetical protein